MRLPNWQHVFSFWLYVRIVVCRLRRSNLNISQILFFTKCIYVIYLYKKFIWNLSILWYHRRCNGGKYGERKLLFVGPVRDNLYKHPIFKERKWQKWIFSLVPGHQFKSSCSEECNGEMYDGNFLGICMFCAWNRLSPGKILLSKRSIALEKNAWWKIKHLISKSGYTKRE